MNKWMIVIIILSISYALFLHNGKNHVEIIEEETIKILGFNTIQNIKKDVYKSIKFIEDLSIGREEGDEKYIFPAPRDIDSDSQGNIYVLDFMDKTIKSYYPDGKYRENISRGGQGPGELLFPNVFCIDKQDYINILDRWKIEILDNKGIYIRTIKLENYAEQISENKIGQIVLGFMTTVKTISKRGEQVYKVGTINIKDGSINNIYFQKQPWGLNIQSQEIFLRYPYFVRWATNSKGNIYVGSADKYEILVFTSEGEQIFKFIKDYESIPVETEIRRKAINLMKKAKLANLEERKKYLRYYPVFMSISTDEQDRVWVMRYLPYYKDKPSKSRTFDVFSSEGQYLFTTKIDKRIYPHKLVFKNGYVYALVIDESYYSRAVRFRFEEE